MRQHWRAAWERKLSYQINAERRNINEAAVVFPAAFAAANVPVVGVLNPRVRTNVSARIDYQLSASNTLMARYQFTHNHEENDGISQLLCLHRVSTRLETKMKFRSVTRRY